MDKEIIANFENLYRSYKRLRAVRNLIQVLQDFLICLLKAFIS